MQNRAQGAIEYLLIIGAAILVVAIVIIAMTAITSTGKDSANTQNEAVFDSQKNLKYSTIGYQINVTAGQVEDYLIDINTGKKLNELFTGLPTNTTLKTNSNPVYTNNAWIGTAGNTLLAIGTILTIDLTNSITDYSTTLQGKYQPAIDANAEYITGPKVDGWVSGKRYYLKNNITTLGSNNTALTIWNTTNITLDCQGYEINPNKMTSSYYGIYLYDSNFVTLKNCSIKNVYYPIQLQRSKNLTIQNITITDVNNYFYVYDVNNSTFNDITVVGENLVKSNSPVFRGFYLNNSHRNKLTSIRVENFARAMWVSTSNDNNFFNIVTQNNRVVGMYFYRSNNNRMYDSTSSNNLYTLSTSMAGYGIQNYDANTYLENFTATDNNYGLVMSTAIMPSKITAKNSSFCNNVNADVNQLTMSTLITTTFDNSKATKIGTSVIAGTKQNC